MAAFLDFYPAIRAASKDCPVGLATYYLRQAAIEFCERTWFWQVDLAKIDSVAAQAEYSFAQPTDAIVYKVLNARYDGKRVTEKNADQLEVLYADWESETSSQPKYITQKEPDKYILVPFPDSVIVDAIYLKVLLKPSQDAATLPDNLLEEYKQVIVAGALAAIKAEIEKAWSDPVGAKMHKDTFENAIGPAKTRAQKGFNRSRRSNRAHYF